VLCESRTCTCGAIALAAPVRDKDEIIDDALGIFRIQVKEYVKGSDSLLLEEIRKAGVLVRIGQPTDAGEKSDFEYTCIWFRTGDPGHNDDLPSKM